MPTLGCLGGIGKSIMDMNENEKTQWSYKELLAYIRKGSRYRTLNGKDILNLPVQLPQNISVIKMLEDIYTKYKQLIRWYDGFAQNDYDIVDDICDRIISILNLYLSGDLIKAYEQFCGLMDTYISLCPSKDVEDNILFYRMRKEMDLKKVEEFYHLPITMREKCSSERFSIAGYPCFYFGYSKNDCFVEISKTGSMIGLTLNESGSIKVLDLTFSEEQESRVKLNDYLRVFPLIAACYVVTMNCVEPEKANFREEYVIPQMLTSYLKDKNKYDGICYYSVRNEDLDTFGRDEKDYRNIVLFTKLCSSENYDMELMKKFHWYEPFCVR